ncbi:MAG: hypothetical protein ACREM1_22765, partial [Longimicrobiales bacterium]
PGVLSTFGGIGTSAAQAVLARPELARAFRTVRRESVTAVDGIIQRALLRGATSDKLERELRLHVLGADTLPARLLLDRRRIGYRAIQALGYEPTRENLRAVRREAGQVANRARLIARTEPMNAEHEAGIQAAIASPVVAAIQWRLSGRHPVRDQCDDLAHGDWFGLGPGIYDPRQVPRRPHPRCLCLRTHVLRSPEEWGAERGPLPALRSDAAARIDAIEDLTPSQKRNLGSVLGGIPERQAPPPVVGPQTGPPPPFASSLGPELPGMPAEYAPGYPAAVRTALRGIESGLRAERLEHLVAIDAATGSQIYRVTTGEQRQVDIGPAERLASRDAIMTHNHPNEGGSLNIVDVSTAIRFDAAEIRAVDGARGQYVYSFRRPAEGWGNTLHWIRQTVPSVRDFVGQRLRAEGVSDADFDYRFWHEIWLELMGPGLQYRREPWRP